MPISLKKYQYCHLAQHVYLWSLNRNIIFLPKKILRVQNFFWRKISTWNVIMIWCQLDGVDVVHQFQGRVSTQPTYTEIVGPGLWVDADCG